MAGDVGDYWREARQHRKAAERRIGKTDCICGARNSNGLSYCRRCGRLNEGFRAPNWWKGLAPGQRYTVTGPQAKAPVVGLLVSVERQTCQLHGEYIATIAWFRTLKSSGKQRRSLTGFDISTHTFTPEATDAR